MEPYTIVSIAVNNERTIDFLIQNNERTTDFHGFVYPTCIMTY